MAPTQEGIKAWKQRRATIKAQCTRVQSYLESEAVRQASVIELRARLQKFNGTWEEFDCVQAKIEAYEDENQGATAVQEGTQDEERSAFESKYFMIVTSLESLIQERTASPQFTLEHQVRESVPMAHTVSSINDNLKLPRVNMPTFTGKYEEWTSFYNIFHSMIDQNVSLPDVQKMQYLISSLKGEAHDVISSLEASAENYQEAWHMLKDRYDDPGLIVGKHVKALFDLPAMNKDNHHTLRKLLDTTLKHLRALRALKRPTDKWDDLMIQLVTARLDQSTYREWETTIQRGRLPTFEELSNFLNQRCRALEAASRPSRTAGASQEKTVHNRSITSHVSSTRIVCVFCQQDNHAIYKCKEFMALNVEQRMKEARTRRLCLNCLRSASHQAKECMAGACRKCGKRHNTLLHLEQAPKSQPESDTKDEKSHSQENVKAVTVSHTAINQGQQVLLATALVNVLNAKDGVKPVRALLDSGSQSCFITRDCSRDLGLKLRDTNIPVCGLGEHSMQTRNRARIVIQSRTTGYKRGLECLVVDKITQNIPVNRISRSDLWVPRGIALADPQFEQPARIDLLLGAEIFFDLVCIGRIRLADNQPTWQKTLLGWVVSGQLIAMNQHARSTSCNLATSDQLVASLTKFWQLENCSRISTRTPEERACEKQFAETYKREPDGRFVVTLPIKADMLKQLGDSKEVAMHRLRSLEKRLSREPQRRLEYNRFMNEYLQLGHMQRIREPVKDGWPHFYMPHHCVIKDSSTTTRLRVVFDASSKTTSGISLNDALMIGPVVQQESIAILLRFRSYQYVLTGDIEKMYRQVKVDTGQTPLQRILWRSDPSDDIETYELRTLTYGTASASFLATKVIQQLASLEAHRCPKGALAASRDFYVDDLVTGANSKEEITEIREQLIAILAKGGFKIRKWACNSREVLNELADSSSRGELLELDKEGAAKTLGINWNPAKDTFQYRVSRETFKSSTHTRRSILSQVAQIFDPLGLLGPVIITAKALIQRLWRLQISWDESLPMDICSEWSNYIKDIREIEELSIPRQIIGGGQDVRREIHGFCDASERAYGACVYMRNMKLDGRPEVHLICSKSRVAPIKSLSIPRLELCGAQLLAQLMERVVSALEISIDSRYYWTDSSIVLHWLQASNKRLPVFVAHRVGDIQEIASVEGWRHVGSKDNPADLLSRGIGAKELLNSQLWWGGPHWLRAEGSPEEHRKVVEYDESQLGERDRSRTVAVSSCAEINPFDKFSTFNKLVRVAATCLRFAFNCKGQSRYGPLTTEELQEAIKRLIRREQEAAFSKDIKDLRGKGVVSARSNVKQLSPFIDEEKLIRVGGRLQHSRLRSDVKHPYLLHQHSNITRLIIEHEHRKLMHAGSDATLAAVRLKYWPLKARGTVRKLLQNCIRCFKARPRFSKQVMGNLPTPRVTPSRPFSCTGVDFCGPICIREGSRRNSKKVKAYVSIFVCLATKAVHLEVVSNLTTDAFLNAFKRFIGRRGKPTDVFSDNGTNFVGANRELDELRNLFKQEDHQSKLIENTSMDQIRWHFIPPRAPHFGGLWEAAVKAFKRHFYKVAADVPLTFEEASTLVIQIEAILNSRPLIPMSLDPNDLSYVSAGHFLIGDTITSYPEPKVTEIRVNRLSRWQHLEQMRQHFWRRWSSEYLLQLQNRTKWNLSRGPALMVGQLIILREDGLPPLKWMLGRVQETFPGSDGIVRTATIKTSAGVFKRPASKIAILPVENDVKEDKK